MKIEENIRIDKWLWAVRLYKTRSLATAACKNNQIAVNAVFVKPSRTLQVGDVVLVKKPPFPRTYKVLGLLAQRESAKVVVDFVEDITPAEEIEKWETARLVKPVFRERGLGRPTKKDRRDMEEFGYLQ
ncbi:MAG: RNA-binding S4 domain-containing protein [Bacteroidales bacterium]|jgi:ribosome-associated heat shock protein Hsp15|nr:RNA-binding S4 domain-containing protein [Bacteroidales bacterium]